MACGLKKNKRKDLLYTVNNCNIFDWEVKGNRGIQYQTWVQNEKKFRQRENS